VPGGAPGTLPQLTEVHRLIMAMLGKGGPGVIVLALDGVSWEIAEQTISHGTLRKFTSTFPSASVPAWLTSVTGQPVAGHGAVGTAYRCPVHDRVANVISGDCAGWPADGRMSRCDGGSACTLIPPQPTVFLRAREQGAAARAIGRELDAVCGPWASALLAGAERVPARGALTTLPGPLASAVTDAVGAQLGSPAPAQAPLLLWTYVNLDDHIHAHGYDADVRAALRALDIAAARWADAGWTVLAHADHGQVAVVHDPALERAWAELDSPRHCRLPGGGAGRVRWLYPQPGHEGELGGLLADALGEHATVRTLEDLDEAGLLPASPVTRERVGEVIAIANSAAFPLPRTHLAFDHGGTSPEEMTVPLAVWTGTTWR
jgi:Type I phosphodiesterase / nucleotide pyrophosphatase